MDLAPPRGPDTCWGGSPGHLGPFSPRTPGSLACSTGRLESLKRWNGEGVLWCERGAQLLLTAVGAFAAFGLMTIAIGTDYWLYARAFLCNTSNASGGGDDGGGGARDRRDPGGLTHSGLWRICCLEGLKRGLCLKINHFPEDMEYDHDSAEYLLRVVRASSIFPILSAVLLLLGGVCVAASRLRRARTSLVLGAGILFVAAGLSNIIGVIVYISANAGDPGTKRDEDKKSHYSYGWSFYFGGLSFILAEAIGVLAVNLYIERHRKARGGPGGGPGPPPPPPPPRGPQGPRPRPRRRSRSSSRSSEPGRSRDASPPPPPPPGKSGGGGSAGGSGGGGGAPPADISMYTLSREGPPGTAPPGTPGPPFLQLHNAFGKDPPGGPPDSASGTSTLNRKTTPV